MRIAAILLTAFCLHAQAPAPQADANDPDELAVFPNGRGRYAWKRKGVWKATSLQSRVSYGKVPAATALEVKAMTGFWVSESRSLTFAVQQACLG